MDRLESFNITGNEVLRSYQPPKPEYVDLDAYIKRILESLQSQADDQATRLARRYAETLPGKPHYRHVGRSTIAGDAPRAVDQAVMDKAAADNLARAKHKRFMRAVRVGDELAFEKYWDESNPAYIPIYPGDYK